MHQCLLKLIMLNHFSAPFLKQCVLFINFRYYKVCGEYQYKSADRLEETGRSGSSHIIQDDQSFVDIYIDVVVTSYSIPEFIGT